MSGMATAMDRLAAASEAQVRALEREERRRATEERERRHNERFNRGHRSDLHPLDFRMMAPAVPEFALIFERVVPPEFWSQDDRVSVIVACPCGAEPRVREAELTSCECPRTYVYTGEHVRVTGTPGKEAADS